MTEQLTPSGDNTLLKEALPERKISRLERFLGPENYRIITGLLKTPASILGFVFIGFFILIAIFAPVIAPPVKSDPYMMPRDGFSAEPKDMGAKWVKNVPKVPFWYKTITGKDEWVHIFGTAQGQYDIFYGIIWGTRTAFKTGLLVVLSTFLIGVIVGSVSAYYGGLVDNILMRTMDVLMAFPSLLLAIAIVSILACALAAVP